MRLLISRAAALAEKLLIRRHRRRRRTSSCKWLSTSGSAHERRAAAILYGSQQRLRNNIRSSLRCGRSRLASCSSRDGSERSVAGTAAAAAHAELGPIERARRAGALLGWQ